MLLTWSAWFCTAFAAGSNGSRVHGRNVPPGPVTRRSRSLMRAGSTLGVPGTSSHARVTFSSVIPGTICTWKNCVSPWVIVSSEKPPERMRLMAASIRTDP